VILIIFDFVAELCTGLMPSYNARGLYLAELIVYWLCQFIITLSLIVNFSAQTSNVKWTQSSLTSETPTTAKGGRDEQALVTSEAKVTDLEAQSASQQEQGMLHVPQASQDEKSTLHSSTPEAKETKA
jgi:hypothetical protein